MDPAAVEKATHWALGLDGSFVVSVGDLNCLPGMLEAAERFERMPGEEEMRGIGLEAVWM